MSLGDNLLSLAGLAEESKGEGVGFPEELGDGWVKSGIGGNSFGVGRVYRSRASREGVKEFAGWLGCSPPR